MDAPLQILVAVMIRFVRTVGRDAEVISLFLREPRQLHADFFQMQPRDFFVEFLWQTIDTDFVSVFVFPKIELRENLVRK